MKFLHLSDTHLGYHQYGLQERAADFFDVFNEAVDFALEKKVDFIIHTGDFFHSSRPSNQIILQGMEILKRLKDAKIPVFVISGNHDRGSQVRDVSPLKILQPLGLNLIDSGVLEYEGIFIGGLKYISKAGLKQLDFREVLEKFLEKMDEGFKILMLHQEFQPFFPDSKLNMFSDLPEGFDYVGIGHYHVAQPPSLINGATVVYPGSTEFTAYNEKEEEKGKGFYIIEVDNKELRTKFIKFQRRRPFLFYRFNEENSEQILKKIKDDLERGQYVKKPVLILKGTVKDLSYSDIRHLMKNEGITEEKFLHMQVNLAKDQVENSPEHTIIELEDNLIKKELQKLIGDKDLSEKVIELIDHLKTIENTDEVKKLLRENPEILDF
ncbi:metallophosphoesterase family protein [Persephonella sp.]